VKNIPLLVPIEPEAVKIGSPAVRSKLESLVAVVVDKAGTAATWTPKALVPKPLRNRSRSRSR
jgi:hypothetical protein